MVYTNERRLSEDLMLPVMLSTIVAEGDVDQDHTTKTVLDWIDAAYAAMLASAGDANRARKVKNRTMAAVRLATADLRKEGQSVAKYGLVAYYLMRAMVDQGRLEVKEGTDFGNAIDIVLVALQPAADNDAMNESAQKQARKFLSRLQAEGYFKEITL